MTKDMRNELPKSHDPDELLFDALRQGDAYALTEVIQKHDSTVRSVVYSVLGKREELEDVVQQVWLTVWRRASSLKEPAHGKTWLYRLARNASIDAGRAMTRRRGFWRQWVDRSPDLPVEPGLIDKPMMLAEQHQTVLEAVENLPAIYREPFVLRHLEDWSYKQISQTLDLTVNTVEVRLVRARRMLREVLAPKLNKEKSSHKQ